MADNLTSLGLRPWVYEYPQRLESFWFEKIDGNELRFWSIDQMPLWTTICLAYFLFVYYGPLWMKDRKPFNLQTPLVIWNFLLAIFSIAGLTRILPEMFYLLSLPNGFHRSACLTDGFHYPMTFWGFAFAASKIAELVDTVFIVLRKKPLIFLHWFHHATMSVATFWAYAQGEPAARYAAVLNYGVHSIMYSYFTVKALRIRVPKKISMMITSIQILQFIVGLSVSAYTVVVFVTGGDCYRTPKSVALSFVLVGAYLYLFAQLFHKSYISKSKRKSN